MPESIATRKGDEGETSLYCGDRVSKNYPRIEALGSLDELNSMLGISRSMAYAGKFNSIGFKVSQLVLAIQIKLFSVGSTIASSEDNLQNVKEKITAEDLEKLDSLVSFFEKTYPMPKGFIIPGGQPRYDYEKAYPLPSFLDVARALARKLERNIITVKSQMFKPSNSDFEIMIKWVNRLSDVLWLVARMVEMPQGKSLELADVSTKNLDYGF